MWKKAVRNAKQKYLDKLAYQYLCWQVEYDRENSLFCKTHSHRIEWQEEYERLRAEDIRHRNEGKQSDSWFVTINPPEGVDPVKLWNAYSKYLAKNNPKTIKAYYMIIEQRSEDSSKPDGWHLHMIIQYKEPWTRSQAIQKMRNVTLEFWTLEQQKNENFTRKWCVWRHLAHYHRAYMEGDKREDKMLKVHADKIIRETHGFPEFVRSSAEIIFPPEGIDVSTISSQAEEAPSGPSLSSEVSQDGIPS